MAETDIAPIIATRRDDTVGFLQNLVSKGLGWARKYSIFTYPYATACCGMEYMSVAGGRHDLARFGAEYPRFSPRQADMLLVTGTINLKQAPILKRVYEQMCEPKWVVAFGVCASSGGFYDNYAVLQGIDRIIPVDVYIPGCPPRPEQVLDAILLLQEKIGGQVHKLADTGQSNPTAAKHDLLMSMNK
ncbi:MULTISPECIES: NADH-quinone oxidoreductase subunit B [Stigmatella]|uniref:NADH-quinone oxidoreductase subunit B n=2 Tax=Stigmatella TaxID=40 RepID=A0A1H7UVD3_STIAU|nr:MULTISPECIES: NADH-quinone oxidoreductase subunit B [Stigmatella]SEM00699.1 NADH dehydrogenase subunit B [Stigmatella aurantiaca]SET47732.1 NADH dehydrogenase subunit B [Stigmatella erecta]